MMKRYLTFMFLALGLSGHSQISIENGKVVIEDFASLSSDEVATLPKGWRVARASTVRMVNSYTDASAQTERRGGNSLTTRAVNGIYNFGDGDANSATDRSVGFLASTTETKSGNLFTHFKNTGASSILNLSIEYDVKKFRKGSNSSGFSIQLYYSVNGINWTSLGSKFLTNFAGDADNSAITSNDGNVIKVANNFNLPQPVLTNDDFYLAWNYSVTSGTVTTNAQALAVDNVIVTANATLPISLISFTGKPIDKIILLNWKTASENSNKSFDLQRSADGKTFTTISTIEGAGNADAEKSYSVTDDNPFAGTNYYKLIQYDFDGQSTSKTITVDSKLKAAQVVVSATHSTVDINISSPNNGKATMCLYDLEGGKLAEKTVTLVKGNNTTSFVQSLSPGIYFLRVLAEGGTVTTKFAKW